MKKSNFTEIQISSVLKEHAAGKKKADICRELGISQNTFYLWKRKYDGMDAEMERENAKLKQMYAELSLDHRILKDVIEKKL